jgi:hypothetical protein
MSYLSAASYITYLYTSLLDKLARLYLGSISYNIYDVVSKDKLHPLTR